MRSQRPKKPSPSRAKAPEAEVIIHSDQLFTELRELIESCRSRLARSVNRELVLLYWRIGTRLAKDVLGGERAVYGEQMAYSTLSRQLSNEYCRILIQSPESVPHDALRRILARKKPASTNLPNAWAGATSKRSSIWRIRFNATSTWRCAALRVGVFAHCATVVRSML